jgi:transposase-like protein
MYEDNAMAISEIANDLGHCNGTIARWLREAGIAIRSQGGANNPWGNPGKRKVA